MDSAPIRFISPTCPMKKPEAIHVVSSGSRPECPTGAACS
jgi:hypothetical protein